MRSSSAPRGRKSRSRLWIAAQASGTGVTGINSPMRDMTESDNAWTRARRSALGSSNRSDYSDRLERNGAFRTVPPQHAVALPRRRAGSAGGSDVARLPQRAVRGVRRCRPSAERQLAQVTQILEHAS